MLAAREGNAAEIQIHASHDCATRADVADQVDALLGRPVSEVEGLDFDVDIAERPEHRWRLRLATINRADGARRSREIEGSGCAQLADAAAIAITMSIQTNRAAAEPAGQAPPPPARPEAATMAAAPAPVARPQPLRLPIAISALVDSGALPHAGWGLGIGAALEGRRWRIIGEGAFLLSPEARVADAGGGQFRLIIGGVLACLEQRLGQMAILGCAGGEAGIIQADGSGINHPRDQNVPWEAGRLELGLVGRLNATLSLFVRAGVTVPWSRPTFTINNDNLTVYRPDAVTGRATVGALFDLF